MAAGEKQKETRSSPWKKGLLCCALTVFFFLVTTVGGLLLIHYGPSASFRQDFVRTVMEEGSFSFLATWFCSPEELEEWTAVVPKETPWPSGQSLAPTPKPSLSRTESPSTPTPAPTPFYCDEGVEIVPVSGKTFVGKMMIVSDPSRVFVGTPPAYGEDVYGLTVKEMAARYDALAAVNGGGFWDVDVKGTGGIPSGDGWSKDSIVISNGVLLYGELENEYPVIGITWDNRLLLRYLTAQEALDRGVRDAVEFGPFLIIDGRVKTFTGSSAEHCEARTAIGQKEDGTILLLVVEGRQPNSLGATMTDLAEVMLEYGAVNAANLDGGQSSYMVYEGEIITSRALLYRPRKIASTILVSRIGGSHEPIE